MSTDVGNFNLLVAFIAFHQIGFHWIWCSLSVHKHSWP